MHEIGVYTTYEGMIKSNEEGFEFYSNNPQMIIDMATGTLLKLGDSVTNDLTAYYEMMCDKYKKCGFNEMAEDLNLITFDRYNGILDIDSICTIINYLTNHPSSDKVKELFVLHDDKLVDRVKELQSKGF